MALDLVVKETREGDGAALAVIREVPLVVIPAVVFVVASNISQTLAPTPLPVNLLPEADLIAETEVALTRRVVHHCHIAAVADLALGRELIDFLVKRHSSGLLH